MFCAALSVSATSLVLWPSGIKTMHGDGPIRLFLAQFRVDVSVPRWKLGEHFGGFTEHQKR